MARWPSPATPERWTTLARWGSPRAFAGQIASSLIHFDACLFQRDKSPGLWRTGPIYVTAPAGSTPAYAGPDGADVPDLMDEVVEWLEHGDLDAHVAVRAAMAHLHVVSVHPFRDGNGRMARIVQSLVLARQGLLAPEFGWDRGVPKT